MKAEALLALYERVADAPEAIPRLRRFVLDLAVRGKLVEQDPEDDPAADLLLRAKALRGKHKGRNTSAREAPHSDRSKDPSSSTVPRGWLSVRLGEVIRLLSGQHLQPNEYSEREGDGVPYITGPSDFGSAGLVISRYALVKKAVARRGQLLLTVKGSGLGKTHLCELEEVAISRQLMALEPLGWSVRFLRLVTQRLAEELQGQARSLIPGIGRTDVEDFVFAIPPLAEQHRIVAKVDELMALLDRLDAARSAREVTRDRLTTASLTRLAAADTAPEILRTHARFALDALPALTTRTDQIKQLRQTILDLAVRGKLSEQASEASDLATEAESDASPAPGVPAGWRQCRLSALLAEDTRNGYSRRPDDAEDGVPILRISAGTLRKDGLVAEEEHKMISGIDTATRGQYGLRPGDLLACRFNGNKAHVGRLSLFSNYLGLDPIYPDKLIRIRLNPVLAIPAYVRLAGDSDLVRSRVELECATTVGNWGISASRLKEVCFPVPSLAEQHRIVAKVDELMALCDRLEAALQSADTTRARLLEALLHEALASDTNAREAA